MVMVHEHGQMWPVLDELERLVTDGESEATAQLYRELLEQLGSHNMKEERIIYPSADGMLPPGDLDKLNGLLRTAEVPAGWVCGGATVD